MGGETTDDAIVWNGFTQAELDAAYNNMAAVADSADRLADWSRRSGLLRQRQPGEIEIAYGQGPRNRFDVFRSGVDAAPLLVFVHGGWWQRNSKEVFSCMAEGALAGGMDVALMGYTLAPEAKLACIVGEVRTALDALASHQKRKGRPARFLLSGWSAGGHLTVQCLDHPAVMAGLAISGVYDLEPIRHSYIDEKLQLSGEEVATLSPAYLPPARKPLAVAFGLKELPELQRQSAQFGVRCVEHGAPCYGYPLSGHDHFSILEELARPSGALCRLALVLGGAVKA